MARFRHPLSALLGDYCKFSKICYLLCLLLQLKSNSNI